MEVFRKKNYGCLCVNKNLNLNLKNDLLSKTEIENRHCQRSKTCLRTVLAKTLSMFPFDDVIMKDGLFLVIQASEEWSHGLWYSL